MLGYALIPAAMLLFKGSQEGWFKASAHGHDDHGHGHDDHGHDSHSHDAHGHDNHDAHPSHNHGHDEHAPVGSGITYAWVATLLIASLLGGRLIESVISTNKSWNEASIFNLTLSNMLEQARPVGTAANATGVWLPWTWPNEHDAHQPHIVVPVTLLATGTWVFGIGLATLMYGVGYLSPDEVRRQFQWAYRLLWNKWYFDELYDAIFVQPAHVLARFIAGIDRNWIDGFIHWLAAAAIYIAKLWDYWVDRSWIDGTANIIASWTYSLGLQLRGLQTGRVRQYVMFIVLGSLAVFVLVSFFWNTATAH
jgi:NADH-quinone oxidoreductase subunit L